MQAACGKMCRHIERGVNLDRLSAQLSKSKLSLSQCEDCFNEIKAGTGKESKSRSSQKKAARLTAPVHTATHQEEKWVCLACGHVGCATLLDHQSFDGQTENIKCSENRAPTSGHAWKHSVLAKHPLAMQAGDNLVYWCFICNMPVEYPMPEGMPLLNTHDDLQLGSWRNPLHDAAEVVRERLSKKKGSLKDSAKMCYTMDPVRCVIRCVIDTAANLKTVDVGNPSTQFAGLGKICAVKGMMNLGNTCFLNAILQNLLALSVLRDHFSQEPRDSEGPLTSSLRSLYQEIIPEHVSMTSVNAEHGSKRSWKGPNNSEKVCNPRFLFDAICAKAPRFRSFQQQDSHELLWCLLEGLNLEERSAKASPNGEYKKVLNKAMGQNGQSGDSESAEEGGEQGNAKKVTQPPQVIPTFVESVFGGQLSSTVHCCECGHVSVVYETILDLSLQIPSRQILKKRQACENQRELSLFGGREDSKPVELVQMMDTQETGLVSKEVVLDDKFSVHEFEALDCGGGGLQSAEGSLEERLWGASADGVSRGFLLRETICVETSTTNAFEQPQDNKIHSKDKPSASGVLLLPYGHSEAASDSRQGGMYQSTDECTLCEEAETMLVTTGVEEATMVGTIGEECKGLSSPVLKTYECYQSSSQLLEGAETLFDINQDMEASKGHAEGDRVTRKGNLIGEVDEKSEQCIDEEDNVSPLCLEACLADFIKSELLCGDNAWECENCSRLTEEKTENKLKTGDGHLFIELMVDSKDRGKDLLGQKDEKDGIPDEDVLSRASSESMECDTAIRDHKVEEIHSVAISSTQGGDRRHNGGDCFTFEVDNDHVNIAQTLADVCMTDEKNELGTRELNNHDRSGGAQSSMVEEKSAILHPLVKKHVPPEGHGLAHTCSKMLPNFRKERLSFFSGFFSKAENHKVKIGQQQKFVKRDATKKFLISRPPLVLTVHLKRFAQDARGRINKLCGHVTFSEFLDLQPFLDPRCLDYNNCVYRLVGIVEHGGTMTGGHYVAFVRGPCLEESSDSIDRDKDSWYHISDSIVQKSTLQYVLGREAYLLFYERQNVKEER